MCFVHAINAAGTHFEQLAVEHRSPEVVRLLREAFRIMPPAVTDGVAGQALRAGKPVFLPRVPKRHEDAGIKPGYAGISEALGIHSIVAVPLFAAGGRPYGVVVLCRDSTPAPYAEEDLATVERAAAQAARWIERS